MVELSILRVRNTPTSAKKWEKWKKYSSTKLMTPAIWTSISAGLNDCVLNLPENRPM